MSILDIGIIVLVVLAILFGLWRGMFKMIYGLISTLAALVIAILLTSMVVTFVVDNTPAGTSLTSALATPIESMMPGSDNMIDFYDIDGNPDTPDVLGYSSSEGVKEMSELFGSDNKLNFLQGPVTSIVQKRIESTGEAVSIVGAVSSLLASYILSIAAFIVLWIVLYILIRLLCVLLKKVVSHTYVGYYLNKVLGSVLGAVIAFALIFGFLTIVRLLGNYEVIIPVNNMINESTVTKLLAENNFLYNMISNTIDIQSIVDKIMTAVGGLG